MTSLDFINKFDKDISSIISEYITEKQYKIKKWINIDKINFKLICSTIKEKHINSLDNHLDKIDWKELSKNPNAIYLLEKNIDKVDWYYLSQNSNAIYLLEQNQDKIDWNGLSINTNAINLLEKNQDKINWMLLSSNSNAIHLL